MKPARPLRATLIAATLVTSCRTAAPPTAPATAAPPPIVQPGAPGEPSRVIASGQVDAMPRPSYSEGDVTFMQGMIGHHQQAIEMVELLKPRTTSEDMKKLALRIEVSQLDEIKMMQDWLEARGQDVPGPHAPHMGMLMPGMLTPEEMLRLSEAKGVAFDRLFLEGMIKHHGGALVMVDHLFATRGAGQESDIYAFASDVVADQRMEMDRMAAMLNALPKELER